MRAPATGHRLAALLLAWLAGAALQLQERSVLPWAAYVALTAIALLALAAGFAWRRRGRVGVLAAFVGAVVAGFAITGWQASSRLDDALAPALEGPIS